MARPGSPFWQLARVAPLLLLLLAAAVVGTASGLNYYRPRQEGGGPAPLQGGTPQGDCPAECECPARWPESLYCDGRGLKVMPPIPARIRFAFFQDNQLDVVPEGALRNATRLAWLVLQRNQITELDSGALARLGELQRLYLDFNNLTQVPPSLPLSLLDLRLGHNRISSVAGGTLGTLHNLTSLLMHNNLLGEGGLGALGSLKSLRRLDLSGNALRSLPTALPATLQQLYLDHNLVPSIPSGFLKALPELQYLRLSHNALGSAEIPVEAFNSSASLLELGLSFNNLSRVPALPASLQHLYLQGNSIRELDAQALCGGGGVVGGPGAPRGLRRVRLDGNPLPRGLLPHLASACPGPELVF
ncbi:fibromodulin-like [Lampetra planeri]